MQPLRSIRMRQKAGDNPNAAGQARPARLLVSLWADRVAILSVKTTALARHPC